MAICVLVDCKLLDGLCLLDHLYGFSLFFRLGLFFSLLGLLFLLLFLGIILRVLFLLANLFQ